MDLNKILSDLGNGWSYNNNRIYYLKYQRIPVAKIHDSELIYIFFDFKIFKQINKFIKLLLENNIKFYLIDTLFSDNSKYDDEFYHYFNLLNYVYGYSNPQFFDFFKKINFDLFENMTNYMKEHDCLYLLDETYSHIKKDLLKKYDSWIGHKYIQSINKIERDDIRDEIMGIDREIKLNLML